jgi:hypothetical protein
MPVDRSAILSWSLCGIAGVGFGAATVLIGSLDPPWEAALWLPVCIGTLGWMSYLLARRLGTSIIWPVFGSFAGLLIGSYGMFRLIIGDSLDKY